MTVKDKNLIEEAKKLSCVDWYKVDLMADRADGKDTAQYLHDLSTRLYHKEEYSIGLL